MKRSSKYYIDTIKAALILKHSEVDEETGEVGLNPEFEIFQNAERVSRKLGFMMFRQRNAIHC